MGLSAASGKGNAFLEDELMVNTGKYDKEDSDFAVMEARVRLQARGGVMDRMSCWCELAYIGC